MNRLIKLQLRNILCGKSFYVCLGLFLLMSPIATFFTEILLQKPNDVKVFPQIMQFLTAEVGIITKIFIALFCCFDFSNGTTKNIISKGYTRVQLLFSKYIGSLIGVFLIYIITSIVTFILFIKNGIGYDSSMLYLFIHSIIQIIALVIFFSTMSFILEKSSAAIIACLFVPTAVTLILVFLDARLKFDISCYWLENISNKFLEEPILQNLGYCIFGYLIYIILFIFVGIQLAKRKDIK